MFFVDKYSKPSVKDFEYITILFISAHFCPKNFSDHWNCSVYFSEWGLDWLHAGFGRRVYHLRHCSQQSAGSMDPAGDSHSSGTAACRGAHGLRRRDGVNKTRAGQICKGNLHKMDRTESLHETGKKKGHNHAWVNSASSCLKIRTCSHFKILKLITV